MLVPGVAVFREARQGGKKHYHSAVLTETKTMAWADLLGELLRMGMAFDVRYVNAVPGSDLLNRVLKYVVVPSPPKLLVGKNLYANKIPRCRRGWMTKRQRRRSICGRDPLPRARSPIT